MDSQTLGRAVFRYDLLVCINAESRIFQMVPWGREWDEGGG